MVSMLAANIYIIVINSLSIEDWSFAKSVAVAQAVTVLKN